MSKPFSLAEQAITGFSKASDYDQYRPSYPKDAVDKLLQHLRLVGQEKARVIDLASGTGKFTELLVARPEKFEVVAVEPHDGMRGTLEEKNLNIEVLKGNADDIPVKDAWGDALIAAQAFHWFPTDTALKEIHRILVPGAAFGMIWNVDDYNGAKDWKTTTQWEQKLKNILAELEDGHPRFRHMEWKSVFEKQQDSNPFQTLKDTFTDHLPSFSLPLGEETLKWDAVWLDDEAVWSRYATLSQIANLDDGKKEEVRKSVFEALKGDDVERNGKGEIAIHGVTYLAWTTRI